MIKRSSNTGDSLAMIWPWTSAIETFQPRTLFVAGTPSVAISFGSTRPRIELTVRESPEDVPFSLPRRSSRVG